MNHVVMLSGGLGWWATGKRVAERYGIDNTVLLFADTLVEDADTYRFLAEGAANIGANLIRVCDGRTPFEVFYDTRFLGNSRLAKCSSLLKQIPCRKWLETNRNADDTILYVGIDWTETHRIPDIQAGWAPYRVKFPMAEPPYLTKNAMSAWARREGIEPPACYDEGLPHSNCLNQGCVRGGQAYWRMILLNRPQAYHESERGENYMRAYLDADVSILKETINGESRPLTLETFRGRVESEQQIDLFDFGGCGCFTDDQRDGVSL